MPGGRDPVVDDLLEFVGRHAGVRDHDDFGDRPLAAGERAFHVALEQRRERLLVLPLGMLRRERLDAVEREEELEIHRLLAPERAVVVERGDALGRRHKVGRTFLGHLGDEVRMACLAGPSFHEGNGSAACAAVVTKTTSRRGELSRGFVCVWFS